ncbi:uncharacterized protein K452DRAFT_104411 [Aplosporella prunicola CBS 121167]|uniref:Uncharacterized protein n=1 Tax=Aplosporella prunicola CBS 121167 TaxID=1176127 RepID=A0A6A6BTP2_9PEZI|nr:uncharacterized protein K452DRAFT_104411 [Aplosporella prunicola CBS 121167]KAF2145991.1 hypothetical protein K452DRAFT_104411 [Aplosporella prunicola CBS 121167]
MLLPLALLAYHAMVRVHLFDRDDTSGGVLMMRSRNEWLGRIGSEKKFPFFAFPASLLLNLFPFLSPISIRGMASGGAGIVRPSGSSRFFACLFGWWTFQ